MQPDRTPAATAAGGGIAAPALRLHDSLTYGCLGTDAYAFGDAAARMLD